MELKKHQDFLAKIYTDASLLEDFFSETQRISQKYDLEEDFVKNLLSQEKQLRFFVQSLINKRFNIIRQILPLSVQILPNFRKIFENYAQKPLISSPQKYLIDAISFCDFILKNIPLDQKGKEVISFEKIVKKIAISQNLFVIKHYHYLVHRKNFPKQNNWWFFLKINGKIIFDRFI